MQYRGGVAMENQVFLVLPIHSYVVIQTLLNKVLQIN